MKIQSKADLLWMLKNGTGKFYVGWLEDAIAVLEEDLKSHPQKLGCPQCGALGFHACHATWTEDDTARIQQALSKHPPLS